MACAWGGVAGYGTAMVLSYVIGQRKYPINYHVSRIFLYVCATAALYCVMQFGTSSLPALPQMGINTVLIILYLALVVKLDLPLSSILKRRRR